MLRYRHPVSGKRLWVLRFRLWYLRKRGFLA